ncbi:MAG: NAD(P)/FAD-dependent oxidoreductase, partial [Deltaproteobacteria bacterium]|nr:NAD(P)/FAD-dependent oxidoreductase [Deltaproteobacteria bacterium]
MNKFDVVVIGAGIGGLSAGALLADSGGFQVLILEYLPFIGGRCSSLKHKGYTMTTGAVAIEGGGSLQRIFDDLGLPFDLRYPEPQVKYLIKGQQHEPPKKGALGFLMTEACGSPDEADRVMKGLRETTELPPPDVSVADWLSGYTNDPGIHGIFRALCGGIISLSLDEAGAAELISLIRARSFRRFGFPPGGNAEIAETLGRVVERAGGSILAGSKATNILIDDGEISGVQWIEDGRKEQVSCSFVISNAGIGKTVELAGRQWFSAEELSRIDQAKAAYSMTIEILSHRPQIDFPGLLYLPEARRAAFAACPSLLCPEWAPEGMHLNLILGAPSRSEEPFDGQTELELLLEDAKEFFLDFDQETDDWIMRSFRKDWPGFRGRPGHGFGPETSVNGLFNVGDSVNPPTFYGVSGAAESAR